MPTQIDLDNANAQLQQQFLDNQYQMTKNQMMQNSQQIVMTDQKLKQDVTNKKKELAEGVKL